MLGIEIATNDIDILFKTRKGIEDSHEILQKIGCLKKLEFLGIEGEGGQYLAIYEIEGITMDLSTIEYEAQTDGKEYYGEGPWKHYEFIKVGKYDIPVVKA